MNEIGIVEAKNVIKSMIDKYNIDYSDYALTSFKMRLERIMEIYGIKVIDQLLNKIYNEPEFIDPFMYEISVPSSEMFRDPSLWRLLREEIIPSLLRENSSAFKIWLPASVSGDELYSLAILISEMNLSDKVQIYATSNSDKSLEIIKSGLLQSFKFDISADNYIRANGTGQFEKYFDIKDNNYYRKESLLKNVTLVKQSVFNEPVAQGFKLVLFRNKMIYYNQVLQYKTVKNIYHAMNPAGIFIIGIQETLSQFYGLSEFSVYNENESIYRRK